MTFLERVVGSIAGIERFVSFSEDDQCTVVCVKR